MFRSNLKLDAKIFDKSARKSAFSSVVSRSAKEFKDSTVRKMTESKPTGKTYERRSGKGFTRSHRASGRGERPAPDTMTLVNSVVSRTLSENKSSTEVTAEYGEILQAGGRPIMTSEDVAEANKIFQQRANQALISLL